jgi:hypothetical protein
LYGRTGKKAATIETLWPLLAVDDLPASLAFWRDRLGFELVGQADSNGQMFWCRRDAATICAGAKRLFRLLRKSDLIPLSQAKHGW